MKAAIYRAFSGPISVEDVEQPEADEHGVVLEVRANGVCRSDWHAWAGHDATIQLPHVPGHEMAGIVASVGAGVERWQVGDRVTVPFSCGCGTCDTCTSGHTNLCEREYQPGFSGWGAFAEFVAVPWADVNLVGLPESIGFVAAASLGCRFMTAYQGLTDRGRLQEGEWIAVHGVGGVGLSAVQIAVGVGAKVVAVDIDAGKLALAESLGASVLVNASEEDPVRSVRAASGGGAHVSVDALGSEVTVQNSIRCLRRRGRHVQIGLVIGEGQNLPIPLSRVISLELEIYGTHGMAARRYSEMFELIERGAVRPDRLVGRTITLDEAPAALEMMGSFGGAGVTVIEL